MQITNKEVALVAMVGIAVVGGLWFATAKLFVKAVDAIVEPEVNLDDVPEN